MGIQFHKKRITLNDIATLSGVSKTTASIILNGRARRFRIKSETCEKVIKIANEYGYRANIYAKSLQAQKTNAIGLVIPDLTNYGFALTAKTLESLCRENELQLIIACSDDDPVQEKLAIENLLDRQIDLLITAPTHQEQNYYQNLIRHTPLLQLDRFIPNADFAYVVSNDMAPIADLVSNMIKKYQLNELFYLGGKFPFSTTQSRLQGFLQGIHFSGLIVEDDWIHHQDYRAESGYQMLANIVDKLGRLPQAIFTGSYTLLEGVLRYLSEHQHMQKLLNAELQLATFDDHELLNVLPFPIHSIQQNHSQIAHRIFALLQKKLQNEPLDDIKVECQIIWRD